jgi:hypothetical protein
MTKEKRRKVGCRYEAEGAGPVGAYERRPFFEDSKATGRLVSRRFVEELPLGVRTIQLSLLIVVHITKKGQPGPTVTAATRNVSDAMVEVANEIWSQACIKLVPYYPGGVITEFYDPTLQTSGECLDDAGNKMLASYDITTPGKTIVNLYLVDDATFACGSPVTGHVILPTAGHDSQWLGEILAHEIGHVLLNPLGVDDSDDPNHLMHHPARDPAGTGDGLFLSECLGAHKRVAEDFGGFADIGEASPNPVSCVMLPRLGNNLVVIEAMQS